jgi:hypothetical protein
MIYDEIRGTAQGKAKSRCTMLLNMESMPPGESAGMHPPPALGLHATKKKTTLAARHKNPSRINPQD